MDTARKSFDRENPASLPSPNSSGSSSSSSNGVSHLHPPLPPPSPAASSPLPAQRSDPTLNTGATTFVQADATSFKQVVQMLTGAAAGAAPADPVRSSIPPMRSAGPKKAPFKLYERRSSMKNVKLSPLLPGGGLRPGSAVAGFSPRKPEILSPSVLDFPSLVLSPVTPLIHDPFNRPQSSPSPSPAMPIDPTAAEERAIAEKGYYLHPSPRTTPRDHVPRLLPLFPVTSPRVASGSSS